MTRDELIALLLMVGFVQDTPTERYPHRAHVYYTDTIAVSLVPNKEWGVWDVHARALVTPSALARARARPHARPRTSADARPHARPRARAIGTPSEYIKCWQIIKELLDDQR